MSRKLTTRPGSEESSEFYRIDRTRLGQTYIYYKKWWKDFEIMPETV